MMPQLLLFVRATNEWHLGEWRGAQDAALAELVACRTASFEVSLRLHLLEALCGQPGGGHFRM
jgi:hypothetical protein